MLEAPARFKAVLWDVGGVLTMPMVEAIPEAARRAQVNMAELAPKLLETFMHDGDGDSAPHRLERGEISLDDYLTHMGELGSEIRKILHPDSPHFVFDFLERNHAMHDFVDEVTKAGYATGIISNVVAEWLPWWEKFVHPAERFDVILYSCIDGVRKPNIEIFLAAARRLDVSPNDVLFFDDSESMVTAARGVGMHTIHVTNSDEAIAMARQLLDI
jgi:putative hydrolase of the HAD superfamily